MPSSKSRYPKWLQCRNQFAVEVRPLRVDQIGKHMEFLHALDEDDIAKLPCDVNDDEYPLILKQQIEEGKVRRIVAWYGLNEIVGSLVIYPGTSHWVEHTAQVVVVTHPDYRRFGIATVLCDEIALLAQEQGISKIYAHLSDFHKEGVGMLRSIGFRREAMLEDHVRDRNGQFHPMYIYGMKLAELREAMLLRMTQYVRLEHRV